MKEYTGKLGGSLFCLRVSLFEDGGSGREVGGYCS